MFTIHMTAASKVGCVRSQNEDMVLVGSHFVRNDGFETRVSLTNNDRYIVAVADGMGGHNAGDYASKYTVETIVQEISEAEEDNPVTVIKNAIGIANEHIRQKAEEGEGDPETRTGSRKRAEA